MKKIILFLIIALSHFVLYSQDSTLVKSMDLLFNSNKVRLRVDKHATNYFDLRTTIKLKSDGYSLSEGIVVPFNKHIKIEVGLGFEQFYNQIETNLIVHGSFRGNFKLLKVRLNYGSNFVSNNVSSSLLIRLKPSFAIGVTSHDENIGPRMEYFFNIGEFKWRLHVSYVEDVFHYGVKIKI